MLNRDLFNPKKIYKFNKNNNEYTIDISLDFYNDLYNEWDFSPYKNRDINEDLFDYHISSSSEIPLKSKLRINFHIPEKIKNMDKEKLSYKGLINFFKYRSIKKFHIRSRYLKQSINFSIFGTLFVSLSILFHNFFEIYFLKDLLFEGLIIGGWVLFWEAFSIFFFKYKELSLEHKHLKRLMNAKYVYIYRKEEYLKEYY